MIDAAKFYPLVLSLFNSFNIEGTSLQKISDDFRELTAFNTVHV